MKTYKAKLINGVTIRNIKAKDECFALRYASQYGLVSKVTEEDNYWWLLVFPALAVLGYAMIRIAG